jgi:hypothetical protein
MFSMTLKTLANRELNKSREKEKVASTSCIMAENIRYCSFSVVFQHSTQKSVQKYHIQNSAKEKTLSGIELAAAGSWSGRLRPLGHAACMSDKGSAHTKDATRVHSSARRKSCSTTFFNNLHIVVKLRSRPTTYIKTVRLNCHLREEKLF